jgi:putative membrane protein
MEPCLATAKYLSQLHGAEFDRAYLQHMVKEHEEAVTRFTAEAKEGRHPALKSYAAKQLPILQAHLELARDLTAKHQ